MFCGVPDNIGDNGGNNSHLKPKILTYYFQSYSILGTETTITQTEVKK